MHCLQLIILWHSVGRLGVDAAPLRPAEELVATPTNNDSNNLEPRQYYNPAFAEALSTNEMIFMMLGDRMFEGVGLQTLMRLNLYRTEATMAGALEPGAEAGATQLTAEEVGATAAQAGSDVFMGDLAGFPLAADVLAAAEAKGISGGWPLVHLLSQMTSRGKYPALTGGEGLELPSDYAVFIENMQEAEVALAQAVDKGIDGLAATVGEDFSALVAAGVSTPLAAAFMIGMTAWAAQWTVQMSKQIHQGWHDSLEGFGTMLKAALGVEFNINPDAPLPNGAPLSSALGGLTSEMFRIYAAVGDYERQRLLELGAPVETFETPDHSQNVNALKTWAQTRPGKQWCKETKSHIIHGLEGLGVSVDLSTMKVPLEDSCPPPGAP